MQEKMRVGMLDARARKLYNLFENKTIQEMRWQKNMSHILVTGGSRGIGAAIVKRFAQAGYRVSFTYRKSLSEAEALAEQTGAFAIRADSALLEEIAHAVRTAVEQHGGVDLLVNNAGIASFALFSDITTEQWREMFSVNVEGAFHYIQGVLPHMIHEKAGRIINISSIWGVTGASCEVHYSAAKAALIGMTRALAKELGPSGITVNCVAPGVVDTDMNAALTREDLAALCDETPLGRIAQPEEIAECVYFLASPGAAFLTGQVLSPNGGICI